MDAGIREQVELGRPVGLERDRDGLEAAVARAAKHPVRLGELQTAAGEYIAKKLKCEAAMVTAGAASALTLGTATCVTAGNKSRPQAIPTEVRYLPKLGGSDVRAQDVKRVNPSYRAFPVRALGQLIAFMELVDDALPDVRVPLLVLHGEHDHTAPVGSAARIAERVRARDLRVRILPRSFHLLAIDEERTIVAAEVGTFFERYL